MKRLFAVVFAGLLTAGLLTGCKGSSAPSDNPGSQDHASKTTITLGVKSDLSSLDPHSHNDTVSAFATRHIYSNLVKLNADNEFVPNLAESWEFQDDQTVAFTLREGVKFHNGQVLTSEDVKYSLEREKQSARIGHLVAMIDSVEVVDDTHFIIRMNTPSNALISSLGHAGSAIMCKSYTEGLEAEGKTLEGAPMGCGPYKFEEWVPGASFSLVKFEDYFDPETAAQNEKLVFKIIPEDSARTIALENGELDIMLDVGTTDANRIRENQKLALDEYETTQMEYFGMNTQKAPFDSKLVRQAMNYAINKEDIVTAAIDGEGVPFDNYIGPSAIGYYDAAAKYEYNPEKAKELLKEAGFENGFTFTCFLATEVRARSATIIQANLAAIGVTMNIEQMEASTFFEKTGNGEHDACLSGWVANAEPDNTYRPLFTSGNAGAGGNRSLYKNPEVDALVDDAATNPDPEKVAEGYKTILKTVSEDAIWAPLYAQKGLTARNKDLQGVINSPIRMHDFYALHY